MSKILIVHPNATTRHACYRLVTDMGHEAIALSQKTQLAEILRTETPALLLLDIDLRQAGEFQLIAQIKSSTKGIPLVLIAPDINPEIEKQGFAAGAAEVIHQECQPEVLREILGKILLAEGRGVREKAFPDRERILLVDDEDSIRSLMERFLQSRGYATLGARSGEEALRIVQSEKPSLILLDVRMPGMTGIETLKKIREIDPEVGVIMVTGVQDEGVAREATKYGSYHYVLKPFDLKYLELVVLTRMALV